MVTFAVGCNSRICPHPVGPIILHALGIVGIIAVVVVVLGIVLTGVLGDKNRHRMG